MSHAYNIDPISHAGHAHNVMYIYILFFWSEGDRGGKHDAKKSSVVMQKARGCADNEVKPP